MIKCFELFNDEKVISFLTNIEFFHLLPFLITTFSLIFQNKEKLLRFSNTFFFFEMVRLKNYVILLSINAIVTVCVSKFLSLLVYQHCHKVVVVSVSLHCWQWCPVLCLRLFATAPCCQLSLVVAVVGGATPIEAYRYFCS